MDQDAFFWQIQNRRLPPPQCAATLGISIKQVDAEAGTIEVEFQNSGVAPVTINVLFWDPHTLAGPVAADTYLEETCSAPISNGAEGATVDAGGLNELGLTDVATRTGQLVMLFLGVKFVLAKSVTAPLHISRAADKLEERIEERLHSHSAFLTGLVRVAGNVGVLLFWIILAANFIARGFVEPTWNSKIACVSGVGLGTGLWFTGLSWGVSLGHGRFSEKSLLRMEKISGVGLLFMALMHGANIAWQMAKHRMQ